MADHVIPNEQREFRCNYCDGKILIPRTLPPTTAPCPHCTAVITSPALEAPPAAAFVMPSAEPLPPANAPYPEVPPVSPASEPSPDSAPNEVAAPVEAPVPEPSPAVVVSAAVPPPVPASVPAAPVEIPVKSGEKPKLEAKSKTKEPKPQKIKKPRPPKAHSSGLIPAMLVLLALILAGGGVWYFAAQELGKNPPPVVQTKLGDPAVSEANYIRIGWQKDAYKLLKDYMSATTSAEKVPYILNGEQLAPKIEDFFGGGVINDSDTPADGFSVYELTEEDRKRGLFMMIYDLPPQFDMKEFFRPLASLEVQYGVDEADLLLSTLARVGNFAMEPMRVHAFFKRTSKGLKLDWEIFAQTKYRTFQNFVELPEVGQTGVFRVFIVEDVPEKGRAVAGTRTYRMVDPANTTDTARVNIKIDSETGRVLSLINWRDTKENRPITKTATVELKWIGGPDSPELSINRFICWEFLGLGGQETPATASTK